LLTRGRFAFNQKIHNFHWQGRSHHNFALRNLLHSFIAVQNIRAGRIRLSGSAIARTGRAGQGQHLKVSPDLPKGAKNFLPPDPLKFFASAAGGLWVEGGNPRSGFCPASRGGATKTLRPDFRGKKFEF